MINLDYWRKTEKEGLSQGKCQDRDWEQRQQ